MWRWLCELFWRKKAAEVVIPMGEGLVHTYAGDGPTPGAEFNPEVRQWCRENLRAPFGILVDYNFIQGEAGSSLRHKSGIWKFTAWFISDRDAVAFKLRWC